MNAWLFPKSQCYISDLFLFSAFTGLAYVDLKRLTWREIVKEEDCSLWISTDRKKTGVLFHVKLLDIPIKIIEKYRGLAEGDSVFHLLGQGRINYALKIIAKHCDIATPLSFHLARLTFATTVCLSQDVPIESLSQMMGHLSIQTTQIYADVTRTKINEDMTKLAERIKDEYELL